MNLQPVSYTHLDVYKRQDELSVTPNVFPKIKQIIRTINHKEIKAFSKELLALTTEQEIKLKLNLFYKERINI